MDSLSVDQLQKEARRAWTEFEGTQQDLARCLELDRSVISRAIRSVGRKHSAVQSRIISYVRKVPVKRTTTYQGKHVSHEWMVCSS